MTVARAGWGALLLLGAATVSCTPAPAPTKAPKPHPDFPIGAGATHALGRSTDDGELKCTACHALTNTNFAQFGCTGCHEHAQETLDSAHGAVGGYVYASWACYACHRDGTAANAPSASADAHDPTQDVSVTALVPTWSSTSIVSVRQTVEALPMRMNHASVQVPPGAAGACSTCHLNADLGNFYPGQFHGALLTLQLPQPVACNDCHAGASPLGFVGPAATSPARTPSTGEMKHDAVAWVNRAPSTTALVTADCSACHVAPSTASAATWRTNASFHRALGAAGSPQPGSCLDCHANTRPAALSAPAAALPPGLTIDHAGPTWLGECATCHAAGFTSWAGGRFHLPGATAPTSCLPCHGGERPTTASGPLSGPPFDFGTNAQNVTHGAGQDCAVCHAPAQDWKGGHFTHGPATLSGTTCVACHSTQRPTTVVSGFSHALAGTGDCFGCHSATSAFTQLGDWAGGQQYPGAALMSSTTQFITVTQVALKRSATGLVTGAASTQATLYNAMLHTSAALPQDAGISPGASPGDPATCWHCHTSAPGTAVVQSFLDGRFHGSLSGYRSAPDAGVTALAQPVDRCSDCHSNMRPRGIVQKSALQPMDHDAKFTAPVTVGSVIVDRLSQLDCSVCHASPGGAWSDGALHASLSAAAQAQLEDCAVCHYPLMADSAKADVTRTASPGFTMRHRSAQVTVQKCDQCHATALSSAVGAPVAGRWAPGALHANLPAQPGACVDCHGGATTPAAPTQSAVTYKGDGQWMNHAVAVVTAKDCVFCHAADARASGGAWSRSTRLHVDGVRPTSCQDCHGAASGGPGTNVPAGLISSATITSASAATGVAGLRDQLSHADLNVTSHDCDFCHRQVGAADAGTPAAGAEWAQASFHAAFTGGSVLVMNGSTGRCSTCHLNLKPAATFAAQNHSAFTGTSGTDCSSCHLWPGAGTPAAPTWRRAAGAPPTISVGGFTIAQPPAANGATTQAGLNALSHPAVPAGGSCTTCHALASGGRGAFGYDHALAPATGCAACHEAGSDLVGTPWTLNAPGAVATPAQCGRGGGTVADRGGNTRPVGVAGLACSSSAASLACGTQSCSLNHFFPSDCGECHAKPVAAPALSTTGTGFVGRWRFQHFFGAPAQQATCCHCHAPPSCRG